MEMDQITIGALLVAAGLVAYLKATDWFMSLPGNVLFLVGMITLTWGTDIQALKIINVVALCLLIFAVGLAALEHRFDRKEVNDEPQSAQR
jgi:uncharacterized membrane protein